MDNKIIELLKNNPLTNSKLKYLLKIDDYQFKNNQIKFKLFKLIIRMNLFRLIIELIKFIPKEKQNKIKKIKIQKNKIRKLIKITKQENNINIYKKKKIENKVDLEYIYINDVDNTLIKSNYIIEEEDINTIKDKISKLINIKKDLLNLIISLCLILKDICDIQKISFKKYLYICIILKVLIFDFDIYDKNIKNEYKKIVKHFNKKNLITGGGEEDDIEVVRKDDVLIINECKEIFYGLLNKAGINIDIFNNIINDITNKNILKSNKYYFEIPIIIVLFNNNFIKNFIKNIYTIISNNNIKDEFKNLEYDLFTTIDIIQIDNDIIINILKILKHDYNKLVIELNTSKSNEQINVLKKIYDVIFLILKYLSYHPEYDKKFKTGYYYNILEYKSFEDILKTKNILLYNIFIHNKEFYNYYYTKYILKTLDNFYSFYFDKSKNIINIIYNMEIDYFSKQEQINIIIKNINDNNINLLEQNYKQKQLYLNPFYGLSKNINNKYVLYIFINIKYNEYILKYRELYENKDNIENINIILEDIFIILYNIYKIINISSNDDIYTINNIIENNEHIYFTYDVPYRYTNDEIVFNKKHTLDLRLSSSKGRIILNTLNINKLISTVINYSNYIHKDFNIDLLIVPIKYDFIILIIYILNNIVYNLFIDNIINKHIFYEIFLLYKIIIYYDISNRYKYNDDINIIIEEIKNYIILLNETDTYLLIDKIFYIQEKIINIIPLISTDLSQNKEFILQEEDITQIQQLQKEQLQKEQLQKEQEKKNKTIFKKFLSIFKYDINLSN
jgi:hypothetical protein